MNPNQISVLEHLTLPGERFTLTLAELGQLLESVIRVAGRMLLPTTLHLGIGRYSELGGLLRALARYPGQVVVYGVPDVTLPNYSNLRFVPVSEEAPLARERFIMVYSMIWHILVAAEPDEHGLMCLLTQDDPALHEAAEALGAVRERGAPYDTNEELTARLLWSIASTFPDAVHIARALGRLGAPLAVAAALYQQGEWRAAARGLMHTLAASEVGLFQLDVQEHSLRPLIALGAAYTPVSLDTETPLTRAALTREMILEPGGSGYVAAFPMLQGGQVWGAVEVRRAAAWDQSAQHHLMLMAALIRVALNEQNVTLPAPDVDAPASPDEAPPPANETIEWPALNVPPASSLLESLFEDHPDDGLENVLDLFSVMNSEAIPSFDSIVWGDDAEEEEEPEADEETDGEGVLPDLDAFAREVSEMRRPENAIEHDVDSQTWLGAEDSLTMEQRSIENQAALERSIREEIEQHLSAAQEARQQVEQELSEKQAQRLVLSDQLAAEQGLIRALRAQLAKEQTAHTELEQALAENQAARTEHEAELARVRVVLEELEGAIDVQQSARAALAEELEREQSVREQIEAQLAAEQDARVEIEALLQNEPDLRLQIEQQLDAAYRTRAELETEIAREQEATEEFAAQLAEQRVARHHAEQALEREQTARTQAEYAAVSEVVATDGLPSGSFLRDVRLFVTRLRERVGRLKTDSATLAMHDRLVDQVVSETNTAIEVLSEIALIAQVDVHKHVVTDLSGLLQEVMASLYQQAAQRQVRLQVGHIDMNISLRGDHETLTRALYNVILSSVYMAVPQSSVDIALARRGGCAEIRVGFRSTEELTARLDSFMHHFDKGVPRRSALALARTVILHHRGKLTSQVQDDNTEIAVTLPLDA